MKTVSLTALEAAKIRRTESTTGVAEAAISASADRLDVELCQGKVVTLETARANAVVSAKPSAVLEADSALLGARIAVEIAAAEEVQR